MVESYNYSLMFQVRGYVLFDILKSLLFNNRGFQIELFNL